MLAYQPKLLISRLVVTGNKTVSAFEVRELLDSTLAGKWFGLYPKRNGLLFPRERLLQVLAQTFPRLASITLSQPNLSEIDLVVTERRADFLWCQTLPISISDCYFADESGLIFAPAPHFSRPLYFEFWATSSAPLQLGQLALPLARWGKLLEIKRELEPILANSIFAAVKPAEARPGVAADWIFRLRREDQPEVGWDLRFDLSDDVSSELAAFRAVLADPEFIKEYQAARANSLSYLDLRFAPKVFYRYNTD